MFSFCSYNVKSYFWVGAVRRKPDYRAFFDKLTALGQHENFTLVGIAGRDAAGTRTNVYIHAKLMLGNPTPPPRTHGLPISAAW